KDSTILVEAFVVEVRLSALYDLGVSPIGEKPNSVSIENILRCLQDEDNAKIISGAKVAVKHREQGTTESEQMIYFEPTKTSEKSNKPPVARAPRPYKFGKSFSVSANIIAANKLFLSFDYSGNALDKAPAKDSMPPNSKNWQWSGMVCLNMGKASIVGAAQDEEKAVFFILCADIKGSKTYGTKSGRETS
ncbi:MAG: hypothetical protein RQ760_03075, partial [Sedimentisphaerales bacterium]|nr:hypothetical protein [Sedimentisphaerales bacterium]